MLGGPGLRLGGWSGQYREAEGSQRSTSVYPGCSMDIWTLTLGTVWDPHETVKKVLRPFLQVLQGECLLGAPLVGLRAEVVQGQLAQC